MAVWWYILYALIGLVTVGIFLPNGLDGGLNNIPLFVALLSILVLLLILKLIRYIRIFSVAKKHLRSCGFEIASCKLLPPYFGKKNYNIIAKKQDKTVKICVLKTQKRYLTYHFADINTVELYKFTRLAIKPRVRQANIISSQVDKKLIGTKRLNIDTSNNKEELNIILFDRFPNIVSDSMRSEALGNSDKICDKLYLYDLNGFMHNSF